jgi:ketosteroid isomerase-like protein
MSREEQVLRAVEEWTCALAWSDTAALDRIYADDFCWTNYFGEVADRTSSLERSELVYHSWKNEDVHVRFYGNVALVTMLSVCTAKYRGHALATQFRITCVFVEQNGKWRLAGGQGTRLP